MTSKSFSVEHKYFEFSASYFSDYLYLKITLDESGKRSASGFQSKNGERRDLLLVQLKIIMSIGYSGLLKLNVAFGIT